MTLKGTMEVVAVPSGAEGRDFFFFFLLLMIAWLYYQVTNVNAREGKGAGFSKK